MVLELIADYFCFTKKKKFMDYWTIIMYGLIEDYFCFTRKNIILGSVGDHHHFAKKNVTYGLPDECFCVTKKT